VTGVARKDYEDKPHRMDFISCDILNAQDCESKLGHLNDVTHIFYVIWVSKATEEENCKYNRQMLQNLLNVQNKNPNLRYFYLQTGTKHYGNWVGPQHGQKTPAREENKRLSIPMFYYDLEDVLFKENKGKNWTYNIARPPTIIGYTARTAMNLGVSLAVYATVLKECGEPLIFPYNKQAYHALREFADARLICRFIQWMLPDPCDPRKLVANEAFNIANGDYYRMKNLWPKLAKYFGMEAKLADKPTTVHEVMKGKEEVWDKVVQKYNLKKYRMQDLATWDFMHATLSREFDELTLVQKCVKAGFTDQINTKTMFHNFFDNLKYCGIIPGARTSSQ